MHNTPHSQITKDKISKTKRENPTRFWLGKKHPIPKRTKQNTCNDCKKDLKNRYADRCKQCCGLSRRGENHPNYIKDRTQLKKSERKDKDSAYMYWRIEVYKRDKYKCKILNSDCKGRLEAHHILNWVDYPELRYDINNGITLCHSHHPRKWEEEKRLSPYFMELVSVSK